VEAFCHLNKGFAIGGCYFANELPDDLSVPQHVMRLAAKILEYSPQAFVMMLQGSRLDHSNDDAAAQVIDSC